jgi:hypothetical protein
MAKTKDYKEMYDKFIDYSMTLHQKNQKKIRVGLKVNILVPLIFLILSFSMSGAKLVFLVLWICSLFGIAFYLVYVEFSDYKMMKQLEDFNVDADISLEETSLIGGNIEHAEEVVTEKLDSVDNRIEEEKQRLEDEKQRLEEEIAERTGRIKERVAQKITKEGGEDEEHH